MSISTVRRRLAGIVIAALAAAPAIVLAPAAHAAAPTTTPAISSGVDFDYLADVFPSLEPVRGQHVFETITIERLKYLLRFEQGRHAVLFGDPTDASTQAEIAHINAAATSIGVPRIYVFNPRIDGGALNVFDWSELETRLTGAGLEYWKNEGNPSTTGGPLIELLNGDDPSPQFVRTEDGKVVGPYLVVVDKDREDDEGKDDRVVASLSERRTAADLDTLPEQTAYQDAVKETLLAAGGTAGDPDLDVSTQFEFYRHEVNRRHAASYADATKYGGEILSEADAADGWRVQQLTYPETIHLLSDPRYASSDVPLLFGGTWCHNTRAVLPELNAQAKSEGIKTVYNLDFSLFSVSNSGSAYDHIRTSGQPVVTDGKTLAPGYLYGDLVSAYLPNAVAEYAAAGEPGASPHWFYPGGDTTKTIQSARRLQVPALLVHRGDHEDASGNRAPVVDQAIRANDNGTYTEYMTEYWFVAGRDLPNTPETTLTGTLAAGGDRLANARDFASEAVDAYADLLGSLGAKRHASSTSVTVDGVATSDLAPGTAPTLAVQVRAPGYAPFVTYNSSGANVPRAVGTGAPAGSVVVLDQDGAPVGAPVALKRDGSVVSVTLPTITSEQVGDVWTVAYLGRGYSIAPSWVELRIRERADVTLAGPTSATYGTAVTYRATVSDGATGTVALSGLPGGPVTSDLVDGTATFTAPASLPAGTYTVTATYSGDDTHASSASAPRTLRVAKAGAKVSVSAVASSAYGTSVKVTVTVVDARGKAAPGKVTLSGAGSSRSATLSSTGRAVLTLPSNLAVKSYTLRATYAGSADVASASATRGLKVTVGKVSSVALKVTTAPTSTTKGKAAVTVSVPRGLATATGKVKVRVSKGGRSTTTTVTLRSGAATLSLPRLAKGTWKVTVTYLGSTTYAPATSTRTLVVKK